jgi:hypothetical protein
MAKLSRFFEFIAKKTCEKWEKPSKVVLIYGSWPITVHSEYKKFYDFL